MASQPHPFRAVRQSPFPDEFPSLFLVVCQSPCWGVALLWEAWLSGATGSGATLSTDDSRLEMVGSPMVNG